MKKLIALVVLMLGLAASARAQVITNAQPVWLATKFQTTCSSTTIGITSSELTGNTTAAQTTAGISQIKVANANISASVCCSTSTNVTCASGAATDGDEIARRTSATAQPNSLTWAISVTQKWFCIATAASTGVTVCKTR